MNRYGCDEPTKDAKVRLCSLQCRKCEAYQSKMLVDISRKPIVWILGGPGSGKGTQCAKIIAKYGYTHLSSGDLLRAEAASGSQRAKYIADVMEEGELVTNDIVLSLLKEAIEARAAGANGFLIDGYPREKSQGIEFEHTIAPPTVIIYFEASHDVLYERMKKRALTSGRFDDNEHTILLRLKTFYENNDMVMKQYSNKIKSINAERPVDAIFADVEKVLDSITSMNSPNICSLCKK